MSGTKPKISNVIGERRLVFRDAPRKKVVVTLGKPRKMKGHRDWECPFRIKSPGVVRLEFGYGVDALQALTTALEGIRSMLDEIGTPLAWSGVLSDHTGFQRMIPIAGPEISARLERLVDRELNRHVRQLERRHGDRLSKGLAHQRRGRAATRA
jgi:hypothetical protein